MLRSATGQAKPDIQKVVDDLLREEVNFDRCENRSAIRDHLVRPVSIYIRETDLTLDAFSRNISATGLGLITNESVLERAIAVLEVKRLRGNSVKILAECRWCKEYGENWFFSGWQFINLKR